MFVRYQFNKLVRSAVRHFENIEKTLVIQRNLDDNEYKIELCNKLLEESLEVYKSDNRQELIEEIADCYEVIDEILRMNCISTEEVLLIQQQKKESRGGFEEKILLQTIDYDDKNPKHKDMLDYISNKNDSEKYKLLDKFDQHIVNFIINNVDGLVYVQKRSPNREFDPNMWELPGGSVESNETFYDCVARELKEETNLTLIEIKKLVYQSSFFIGHRKCAYTVFHVVVDNWDGFRLEQGKAVEFKWISQDGVELLNIQRDNEIDSAYLAVKEWFKNS